MCQEIQAPTDEHAANAAASLHEALHRHESKDALGLSFPDCPLLTVPR